MGQNYLEKNSILLYRKIYWDHTHPLPKELPIMLNSSSLQNDKVIMGLFLLFVLFSKKCNLITIIDSKMTNYCVGREQMKSEIRIRKREDRRFKTRAKSRQRWSSSDVRWKTVPQTSGHNRKHSVA